jgi:hypothetical protein
MVRRFQQRAYLRSGTFESRAAKWANGLVSPFPRVPFSTSSAAAIARSLPHRHRPTQPWNQFMSACVPQRPRNRCPVARRTSLLLCCDGLVRASCAMLRVLSGREASESGFQIGRSRWETARSSSTAALTLLCCASGKIERQREREASWSWYTRVCSCAMPCYAMPCHVRRPLSSVPAVPPRPRPPTHPPRHRSRQATVTKS